MRARTGGTAELRVEHLWDGRAAEPGEVVRLAVEGLTDFHQPERFVPWENLSTP